MSETIAGAEQSTTASPRWVPLAAISCTLLFWASAFVAIRHLAPDFSAGALSLGRLLVGSLCLGLASLSRGLPRPSRRDWAVLIAIGALWFGVYNLALNQGERQVDAGTAAMLIQLSPVLIAVLSAVFLRERFTAFLGLGLALAFGGVVLIATSSPHDGGSQGTAHLTGVLLCLVSAVSYAISLILQKPLVARLSPLHVTWLACSIGAVCCLPWAGQLVHQVAAAPAASTAWLVYLGIFPTALAFTTYAVALRLMDASRLGVTTYLVPPITIALGVVFLGEAPPPLAYAGGALALVGVGVSRRSRRRAATPARADR